MKQFYSKVSYILANLNAVLTPLSCSLFWCANWTV